MALVTTCELETMFYWFKEDKSPGLDAWPVDFFLEFYGLDGNDILKVVEESRSLGKIYDACNAKIHCTYLESRQTTILWWLSSYFFMQLHLSDYWKNNWK